MTCDDACALIDRLENGGRPLPSAMEIRAAYAAIHRKFGVHAEPLRKQIYSHGLGIGPKLGAALRMFLLECSTAPGSGRGKPPRL